MDREQIEAMLAEQEANMGKLKNQALIVRGALTILREQLAKIDAAEAAKVAAPEEEGACG